MAAGSATAWASGRTRENSQGRAHATPRLAGTAPSQAAAHAAPGPHRGRNGRQPWRTTRAVDLRAVLSAEPKRSAPLTHFQKDSQVHHGFSRVGTSTAFCYQRHGGGGGKGLPWGPAPALALVGKSFWECDADLHLNLVQRRIPSGRRPACASESTMSDRRK